MKKYLPYAVGALAVLALMKFGPTSVKAKLVKLTSSAK